MPSLPRLDPTQQALVDAWLPDAEFVADLSWELMGTAVLRLRTPGGDRVVKAGGPANHHIGREIAAHLHFTGPWTGSGRAARMLRHDADARILVLTFLPGSLVDGTPAERDPALYRQAGSLLAALHRQAARPSDDYELRENQKALRLLESDHRIAPEAIAPLRAILDADFPPPVTLVPTHGDWIPRNWLVDGDTLRAIDFGRADWRPAATDFARLAAHIWRADPALETAFLDGYGSDPRSPSRWRILQVREAIGTAVWTYQMGDEPFERQGHRMIEWALADA